MTPGATHLGAPAASSSDGETPSNGTRRRGSPSHGSRSPETPASGLEAPGPEPQAGPLVATSPEDRAALEDLLDTAVAEALRTTAAGFAEPGPTALGLVDTGAGASDFTASGSIGPDHPEPDAEALRIHLLDAVVGGKKLRPALLLGAYDLLHPDHGDSTDHGDGPVREDLADHGKNADQVTPLGDLTDPGAQNASAIPEPRPTAREAAAAVELLHQSFLLHDDVIDADLWRRGRANVYGHFAGSAAEQGADRERALSYGRACAVLGGDHLLSAAHQVLARVDADRACRIALLDALRRAVADSAAGEQTDARFGVLGPLPSPAQVQEMLRLKTAAYSFRLPLELAGVLAGRPPEDTAELAGIGDALGVLYQIRDDLLGTFGDPARTGKPNSHDLREGKATLLVVAAAETEAWDTRPAGFGDPGLTEEAAEVLRDLIRESGALERVERILADRLAELNERLEASRLPQELRAQLGRLAEYCTRRES